MAVNLDPQSILNIIKDLNKSSPQNNSSHDVWGGTGGVGTITVGADVKSANGATIVDRDIKLQDIATWLHSGAAPEKMPKQELTDLGTLFAAVQAGTVSKEDAPKLQQLRNSVIAAFATSVQEALTAINDANDPKAQAKLDNLLRQAKGLGILKDVVMAATAMADDKGDANKQQNVNDTRAQQQQVANAEKDLKDRLQSGESLEDIVEDLKDGKDGEYSAAAGRSVLRALVKEGADGETAKRIGLGLGDAKTQGLKELIGFLRVQAGRDQKLGTADDIDTAVDLEIAQELGQSSFTIGNDTRQYQVTDLLGFMDGHKYLSPQTRRNFAQFATGTITFNNYQAVAA